MKKCLVIMLCILIVCTSGIIWAHASVNSERDNVTLNETVLWGDKSEAENLSVTTHVTQSGHLFWDTTLKTGKENLVKTDFRFSQKKVNLFSNYDYGVSVDAASGCGYMSDEIYYDMLPEAAQFAADRTQNGETHSETVNLKDFYEYFPLRIVLDFKGFTYYSDDIFFTGESETDEIKDAFLDYFKLPIEKDFLYDVTIQKDAEGVIVSYEGNPDEDQGFWLTTLSAVANDACYFTFDLSSSQDISTDCIKGGYGIYRLPFSETGEQQKYFGTVPGSISVDAKNLSTVYQLEKNIVIIDFKFSEKHNELILTTIEDGFYCVTVLDASTGKELNKIKIMEESSESEGLYSTFYYDDFMVIKDLDNRFSVIEIESGGKLVSALTTAPFKADLSNILNSSSGFAWNGEKLAFASYICEEYADTDYEDSYYMVDKCGFYMMVLNEDGVLYCGKYDSSLDINSSSCSLEGWDKIEYNDYNRTRQDIPVTVSWD
ncbi:MAG: hypothetical protein Q4C14_04855 [Bacillota bacterium]|nr:hypothetical protein [Bacillota bacterium]